MLRQGGLLVARPNDIFFLKRNEVPEALFDYYHVVGASAPGRAGPAYWPPRSSAARGIIDALSAVDAAAGARRPAGGHHRAVHRHALGHHLGQRRSVARRRRERRTARSRASRPRPASPRARRASSSRADQIGEVQEGEILVAPLTAPSWAPIFGKIAATVTDIGGMMSHAAIVCREYGLPAVTGTGFATVDDQDRPAHPGRRQRRHRHHPRLTARGTVGRDVDCPPDGPRTDASHGTHVGEERDADRRTERRADPGRTRHADGRAAAPLLVPDRVRAGLRRRSRPRPCGCSARTGRLYKTPSRPVRHRRRGAARTGAPR